MTLIIKMIYEAFWAFCFYNVTSEARILALAFSFGGKVTNVVLPLK